MKKCKEHSYGEWTRWTYYGMRKDTRERYCVNCPYTDYGTREHEHSWGRPFHDPYAPVHNDIARMLRACSGCSDTEPA